MALLTGNSEASLSLLWTGRMHVKDAGIAAFITEAHPADGDSRGVFRGRGELHILLSTHTVSVARLVAQQGLVLGIQPTHLPQRLPSFPRNTASQSEGLLHWSFQTLGCCYPAWNIYQYKKNIIVWQEFFIWVFPCLLFVWQTHPVGFPPSSGVNTHADLSYRRPGSSSSSSLI